MAEERPGFLGRWARRKTDVLQGRPLDEPAPVQKTASGVSAAPLLPETTLPAAGRPPDTEPVAPSAKLLSLDDVKSLTGDSDFKPFMARQVGADVRNAAMKKLFADPHYNVMDGLDIYIGDYSIADPIPESMLRQMVGAKLLKIFDDEEDKDDDALESPVLAAEEDPPIAVSSEGRPVNAADDDRQVTSVLPTDKTPVHRVPLEPGVDHASALPAPQEAGQQENSLADTAESGPKFDQVAILPKL